MHQVICPICGKIFYSNKNKLCCSLTCKKRKSFVEKSPKTGNRKCKNCNKIYLYTHGQANWLKNSTGQGKGSINSIDFCSYTCAKV